MLLDFCTVFGYLVNICMRGHVNGADFTDHMLVNSLSVHLTLNSKANLRQFITRLNRRNVRGRVAWYRLGTLRFDLVEVDRAKRLLKLAGCVNVRRIQT
jgi:hypothetical protein